jgi:peptide/nickel transport system substrate-binding protein
VRAYNYVTAEKMITAMGLYVYVANLGAFWYWRTRLGGISYQGNPDIGGGGDLLYFWMTKG